MLLVSEIIEKLKDIISSDGKNGKVYDKDVADALDMTQINFATMKKRDKIPFDRILDKDTHATLEGVIQSAIRVYLSDSLFEALPMLMNVKYGNENYNTYFVDSIYEKMKGEMLFEKAWFSRVEKRAYWYLFLEQCVGIPIHLGKR